MIVSNNLYYLQTKDKNIRCKMFTSDDKYFYLGFGRLGKYDYSIKDKNCKISWGVNNIPYEETNVFKDDKVIRVEKKKVTLKKIKPYLNINDDVKISIVTKKLNNYSSQNKNINIILNYINNNKKNKCTIIDINLWDPYDNYLINGSYILKHNNVIFNIHFRDIDTLFTLKKI